AVAIGKLESASRATWRACRVASHTSPDLSAKLALAILNTLTVDSEDRSGVAEQAQRYLIKFLIERASNLGNPVVWERLLLSPIVGSILTIIGGGALALLEMRAPGSEDVHRRQKISPQAYTAVALFSLAVLISARLGIWIRTHELLGPSLVQQKKAWMSLGFS